MKRLEVELKEALDNEGSIKIADMMNNEKGISDIFKNRWDRLVNSEYSWLIIVDGQEVGFANLVREKANYNFLFLDRGIKEEYRNMGIGKEVLRLISEKVQDFVIIENRIDNISAQKSANQVGCYLTTIEDRNLYLLQKDKLEEFIEFDGFEKLAEHMQTTSLKKEYIKEKK